MNVLAAWEREAPAPQGVAALQEQGIIGSFSKTLFLAQLIVG